MVLMYGWKLITGNVGEEKLMFGPYIHHLGCVYGHYLPVLRERYLDIWEFILIMLMSKEFIVYRSRYYERDSGTKINKR